MAKQQNKPKKEPVLDITKLVFKKDKLLVKAIRAKGKNGLLDPAQYEDKPEWGIIITVGTGIEDYMVGDIIRFGKYSTELIRCEGEDYFIVREEDVDGHMPR